MRSVLKFKLPEEKFECSAANVGTQLALAFQEIDQRLRTMSKYEDKVSVNIETMREMLREETDFASFIWE